MPKKTVAGHYADETFVLENTWLGGAKLLHNDEVIATNNSLFSISKKKPLMSARVSVDGTERLVEAFGFAMLTVKLQIRVDGNKIAGDEF